MTSLAQPIMHSSVLVIFRTSLVDVGSSWLSASSPRRSGAHACNEKIRRVSLHGLPSNHNSGRSQALVPNRYNALCVVAICVACIKQDSVLALLRLRLEEWNW